MRLLYIVFILCCISCGGSKKTSEPSAPSSESSSSEPNIEEFYYSDADGNKIETIENGMEEIYFYIKTVNSIGQGIDIELDDKDPDLIYNDVYLTANDSFSYVIQKNVELIKVILYDGFNEEHIKIKKKTLQKKKRKEQ